MLKNINRKFIKIRGTKISLLVFSILFFSSAYAQDCRLGTHESDNLWGIGTSITYPLGAQIYMVQASYSASENGDVLCGVAYQNWKNDRGRAHAYTLLFGYRHFFWKGLHAEVELWPAYNPFDSSVDGETYSGFELWMSLRIGYRFDFELAGNEFFILAQPSIGFGVARENPWPDKDKDDKVVFEPQLVVGFRF